MRLSYIGSFYVQESAREYHYIYHNPEDLYEIPFLIKKMVTDYKLYSRHHSDTYAVTVVYATI